MCEVVLECVCFYKRTAACSRRQTMTMFLADSTGPATFKGSIKRFVLACLFLGFIYLMYYAYTELSAKYDALVNG